MYLGIDIHKQYAQVAVMDENGEIDREVRVDNANLGEIAQEYTGSEAAIEATGNYYHIHDTLSVSGCGHCQSVRAESHR